MYIKPGATITSRGCDNQCWFCEAWKIEGPVRELEIKDGWNILDNNLLGCSDTHIDAVFQMLARQKHRAVFSGGLEAKLLKPWHAARLRELRPQSMYFAYDTPDDYEPLVQAGKIMRQEGHTFEGHTMACYCLIGYPHDSFDQAEKRLKDVIRAGFLPYAMLFRGRDGKKDRKWGEYQREWLRQEIVAAKIHEVLGGNSLVQR